MNPITDIEFRVLKKAGPRFGPGGILQTLQFRVQREVRVMHTEPYGGAVPYHRNDSHIELQWSEWKTIQSLYDTSSN